MESDHDLDRDVGPSNAESSSSPSNRSKQVQDLSDIDIELAFLRCLPFARPVGKHRHFRMIALQGKIREMTGVVLACEEIWAKLGELYNLEDLDEMASSSASYPASPRSLSPLPRHPLEYGFPFDSMYSEDDGDLPPEQGTSREHRSTDLDRRIRQSSSDSLSPAPDLPKVPVDTVKGKRGKKRPRKSDPSDSVERARSTGTTGTRRGRTMGDQSIRGRSRSNVSETPSTMTTATATAAMMGQAQTTRSMGNVKGKQKEGRTSLASPIVHESSSTDWVYPALHPYPVPLTAMDMPRQLTPAPPDSRPKARHSRASFTPSTSARPTNKRWSGVSDDADHTSPTTRYYERNPINPPAYLTKPSGSKSADLINSRFFGGGFSLPLFADPEVVAEWNGQVVNDQEAVGGSDSTYRKGWIELVHERAGRRTRVREEVGPELVTYEVKQEIIDDVQDGMDRLDQTSGAPKPDTAGFLEGEPEVGGLLAAAPVVDPPTMSMEVDTDPAEAEAEMDVDMQLMGDEGDQAGQLGERAVSQPIQEATSARSSAHVSDEPIIGVEQESALESPRTVSGRRSLASLLAPGPEEKTSGLLGEPDVKSTTAYGATIKPEEEDDLDPEFRGMSSTEPKPAQMEHSRLAMESRLTRRQAMSVEIPRSDVSTLPGDAPLAGPSQSRSPEPREDRRRSLRGSSGRGLLGTSPRETEPPQTSISFMLNPIDQDVPPVTPAGRRPTMPDLGSSTSFRELDGPPHRRTSFPQPLAQQSPISFNLESQLITPHGFHVIPRTPNRTGSFSLQPPSTPSTPLGPSHRSETKLAPRSPTPPRMSTGPVDLPPVPYKDPFPPIAMQTPSPSVSLDEMKDTTETEDVPQTPATSPPVAKPNKSTQKMPKKKPSPDAVPANILSSSRSRSTESPERQTRTGRQQTRPNSARGRGASRGHSRARDTSSSARRSTHSAASSTAPRPKTPPPSSSTRPRPKQAKRLQSINEAPSNGESSNGRRQPIGRAATVVASLNNRMDRSVPSLSGRSLSNNDPRLASQLSYDDDTTDHHSAVGSEDELALKPKEAKKKKPSLTQAEPIQAQPSGSSGSGKEIKKKKIQQSQPSPRPTVPTGPAKATRSNDVSAPKNIRRLTRSKR